MYYDLIASLPHLPHFEHAPRLPITSLRLKQRLARLQQDHSAQLNGAQSLVRWRPARFLGVTDAKLAADYSRLMESALNTSLRAYVALRINQQTLVAALRRKRDGLGAPERTSTWAVGPLVETVRRRWDTTDFGLSHAYPWLPQARELLTAGDARGLERLLTSLTWRWLTQSAERSMFGFESVFSYVFKWDILRAWVVCEAERATLRFADLVDEVTHVNAS